MTDFRYDEMAIASDIIEEIIEQIETNELFDTAAEQLSVFKEESKCDYLDLFHKLNGDYYFVDESTNFCDSTKVDFNGSVANGDKFSNLLPKSAELSNDNVMKFGHIPKRRQIRKIFDENKYNAETVRARFEEQERLKRLGGGFSNSDDLDLISLDHDFGLGCSQSSNLLDANVDSTGSDFHLSSLNESKDDDEVVCIDSSDDERSSNSDDSCDENIYDAVDIDNSHSSTSKDGSDRFSFNDNSINNVLSGPQFLINPGHSSSEPDLYVSETISIALKQHQKAGVRFMYQNLIESLRRYKQSAGLGCLLAHSMGLGKTLQVIAFIDTLFTYDTPIRRVLIIAPVNTLQHWLQEFDLWATHRKYNVSLMHESAKSLRARFDLVQKWQHESGSVLLLGYEQFRNLTSGDANKSWKRSCLTATKKKRSKKQEAVVDIEEEELLIEYKRKAREALFDPGPDIVVCDEGHRIKNLATATSQALANIKTRRRLVLTGYPLQNNLSEYYFMVDFVRPNYLGSRKQFVNMFERPIMNGQCIDSTESDIKLMRGRSHMLTKQLKGFVHRCGTNILERSLPPKHEFILYVNKSRTQKTLYANLMKHCMNFLKLDGTMSMNPIRTFAMCCKIWNHPDILYNVCRDISIKATVDSLGGCDRFTFEDEDLDLEYFNLSSNSMRKRKLARKTYLPQSATELCDHPASNSLVNLMVPPNSINGSNLLSYDWAVPLLNGYTSDILDNGTKFLIAFKLIDLTVAVGDKMLVFSQSLFTLNLFEKYLSRRPIPKQHSAGEPLHYWKKNRDYVRLDGSTVVNERRRLISRFQCEKQLMLFLISTRAGSLGINLTSANRVLMMDVSWNPCHDCQAIFRVYRYGQLKPCYVYRLIMDKTMERGIHNRQMGKQSIAERIVDEKCMDHNLTTDQFFNLMHYDQRVDNNDLANDDAVAGFDFFDNDAWDIDPILSHLKVEENGLIARSCLTQPPILFDLIMIDKRDKVLSSAEKKEARRHYLNELKAYKSFSRGMASSLDFKRDKFFVPSSNSNFDKDRSTPGMRPVLPMASFDAHFKMHLTYAQDFSSDRRTYHRSLAPICPKPSFPHFSLVNCNIPPRAALAAAVPSLPAPLFQKNDVHNAQIVPLPLACMQRKDNAFQMTPNWRQFGAGEPTYIEDDRSVNTCHQQPQTSNFSHSRLSDVQTLDSHSVATHLLPSYQLQPVIQFPPPAMSSYQLTTSNGCNLLSRNDCNTPPDIIDLT